MISFLEARQRLLASVPPLDTEPAMLEDALGRVLAVDARVRTPLPAFDVSAMDGYAVNCRDLAGPSPHRLPVDSESRAGVPAPALQPGTACRIFTGAVVPVGADAVVIQENVERRDTYISFNESPGVGQHIRRRGSELAADALAIASGTRLNPFHLSLLASLDMPSAEVYRRPRVNIISTGTELRSPGQPGPVGSIPESNSIGLQALARRAGALAQRVAAVRDNIDDIKTTLTRALKESDVLVTVGGVSVGDHDLVRDALEAVGVEIDFWKVAIKPGKPLVVGRHDETWVLGLPGNPVSAQLTFCLFGLPLLRALQGLPSPFPTLATARLSAPIHHSPGRLGFYRVRLKDGVASPESNHSSGSTRSLAWADALALVPDDSSGLETGALVDVLELDRL